jgi:steroid delta-isomerase-like uncharacterized protein
MEEVWNRGNEGLIDELLTAESVGHLEGMDTHGPEPFRAIRAALLDAFPDLHIDVESALAWGDEVALRWRLIATHLGDGLGFPRSGRQVEIRGMSWFRFAGGKMVEGWDAWNQGALLARLGAPLAMVVQTATPPATAPMG